MSGQSTSPWQKSACIRTPLQVADEFQARWPASAAEMVLNGAASSCRIGQSRVQDLSILVYSLAFGGGFVIMSLELLGGRVLAPWFGSSIYVWGSIITVFMASLATGYLLGGRWSLANPSLVRFGCLFLAGAALLYPLVHFSEPAMAWIFERIEDPRYGSLAASCMLFVLPTVLLGMISPYSVRLLARTIEESGNVAGRLYFASTFGSTLGTLGTSFYFVLWFEIDTILTLLTASLVPMGLLAIACGMRRP